MANPRLQHIDAWRFVAIVFVLISHILAYSHPWYGAVFPGMIWRVQILGLIGVKIFFCISGYVICRGMMRETEITGKFDMIAFYRRRAYRILPPLLAYIAAVALLTGIGVFDIPAMALVRAGTFLCNITPLGPCFWALGHTWSLAYEEQFYLLFPLLFSFAILIERRGRILALILALMGGCVFTWLTGRVALNTCLSYFLCMLFGCASALYWETLQPALRKLPLSLWLAAVIAIPASAAFAFGSIISQIAFPILLPILISIAVFGTPTDRPPIRKIFHQAILIHIGRISYGIYLWQQLGTADYSFSSPAIAWVLVACACVLAHYSYVYFEQPLIARGARTAPALAKEGAVTFAQSLDHPLADDSTRTRMQ
jgi:peptidoglycan/LPS O-acetylase OafA/YrhL